jgi:UDP-3-O-[3-hydroxymyristoyl] N-acetylglucosamine deacetylase
MLLSDVNSSDTLNMTTKTVLVVDDEEGIRKTLNAVLQDEGYQCLTASSGKEALELLESNIPDLVLLDIWMPVMDGLEVLQIIKNRYPDLPVVMISGHATIQTAVQATKLGAREFIEKPLDLHGTLDCVKRALYQNTVDVNVTSNDNEVQPFTADKRERVLNNINPIVFKNLFSAGQKIRQKTIGQSSVLYGLGVHTGQKSGLVLEPLPVNMGIHFVGVASDTPVPAHIDYVKSTGFATTLRAGDTSVATIEHLMSAFHAYGITNVLVKCNGEVPVMDGSSLEFCKLLDQVGIVEQEAETPAILISKTIKIGNDKEYIQLEPSDKFSINYTLHYPAPLGRQELFYECQSVEDYKKLIAPARTFGFVKDINALQQKGLAQGGRFNNFVLYGEDGPVNVPLRFPDEAVRHKILDCIGDLYLLGRPIQGKVTAYMTGHSDNVELLKEILKEYN